MKAECVSCGEQISPGVVVTAICKVVIPRHYIHLAPDDGIRPWQVSVISGHMFCDRCSNYIIHLRGKGGE
jgi:hypothetical protein